MQPDDTFARRVCAVLLADVTGYSALMGQDDERAARAIHQLHELLQTLVAECGGHAEPVAGDALLATFDSVVAAVTAALRIHERLAAEEFAGTRLQTRIGVHFGDVLLRGERAFGDAINIAARLQTLAAPGTVCISDGVYRHVRQKVSDRVVDLGMQRLKNISDPVHAYLIVPQGSSGRIRTPRPRALVWGGAVAATAVAGIVAAVVTGSLPDRGTPSVGRTPAVSPERKGILAVAARAPAPLALGVMRFQAHGDETNDWQREALRDGLNAQLSQLSSVKVYSKEFIDFLTSRQGLSEVEAATKLGISKMLSGSLSRDGDTVRVETHVVDVATGVLESSYTTEGDGRRFMELQDRLTMAVITNLGVPIDDAERARLAARGEVDAETMKTFLEAEGLSSAPRGAPSSSTGTRFVRWWALQFVRPAAALAQEGAPPAATDDEAAVRAVLEAYRQATEAREIDAVAAVFVEFPPEQEAAQRRYFENVRDLKVVLDCIDVAVVGDEAVASYTRTDDFTDARTGRPMHVSVHLTKLLRRHDGTWKLAANE